MMMLTIGRLNYFGSGLITVLKPYAIHIDYYNGSNRLIKRHASGWNGDMKLHRRD